MPNIIEIISKLDEHLYFNGQPHIDPVEANQILEKAGLLNDSKDRPGLSLRNLLRKGLLPHAYQKAGKGSSWIIPNSKQQSNPSYKYETSSVIEDKRLKGKDIFTAFEIETIKRLINEKLSAPSNQQKGIRQQIRNLGFYYTKYNTEGYKYDLEGFEFLIKSGQITINKKVNLR